MIGARGVTGSVPSSAMFVKICGITNEEDALLAIALGADALGFIFAPGSPRQVTAEAVGDVLRRLPAGVVTVGVFRDERKERVVETVNQIGLGGAQLHGREPMSDVRWIRTRIPFVIQAFAAGDPAIAAVGNGPVDIVLVDSPEPGSGVVFDWALAEGVPAGVRLLLAGGLNAENVGPAIHRVRPWGVDVDSGVETFAGSGRKDARKLRRFIDAARAAGDEVSSAGWTPDPDSAFDAPYDWMVDGS